MAKTQTREIKTPDAPATSKQTMMIFRLGGGDVRPDNLTMQQASDLIQSLMRDKNKEAPKDIASASKNFQDIFNKATEEANAAGDKWWNSRCNKPYDPSKPASFFGMLDLCGFASLVVTDKRTAFYKWYVQQYKMGESSFFISHSIYVPHKYQARQDLGLREACVKAAADVFHQNGIKGLAVESRLD